MHAEKYTGTKNTPAYTKNAVCQCKNTLAWVLTKYTGTENTPA
jgi:hypothetical protein